MVNEQELKGGHAPAEKVGGVRRRTKSKSDNVGGMAAAAESTPEENVEGETPAEGTTEGEEAVVEADPSVVTPYKENTPDAVKSFHEKPIPSKDFQVSKNPQVSGQNMRLNQPRK
eukprot:sb/3476719/